MTHSQNQNLQTKTIIGFFIVLALIYWACGTDTNVRVPIERTKIILDIDVDEARAMSTDSLHPDSALMYRGKDGIHIMYNYSK